MKRDLWFPDDTDWDTVKEDAFNYKGKNYYRLTESKIKYGDKWYDIVIYACNYNNPDGRTWTRFKDDFYRLFKPGHV